MTSDGAEGPACAKLTVCGERHTKTDVAVQDHIKWDAAADAPPGATFQLLHSRAAGLSVHVGSTMGADDIVQLEPRLAGPAALDIAPFAAQVPTPGKPPGAAAAVGCSQGGAAAAAGPAGDRRRQP